MMSTMNPARVPNKNQMEAYLNRGLTQQEIAEQWEKDSNIRVSRSAVGLAIARYGLESATPRKRYDGLIPWAVAPEHRQLRDVKMLRLESRRRAGLPMTAAELRRLENWKTALLDSNAVIYYEPNTDQGWFWVPREDQDRDLIREPR